MPFQSAELKMHYEALHQAGVRISASEAARLFQAGQLEKAIIELTYFAAEARRIQIKVNGIRREIVALRSKSYGLTQAEHELMARRTEALEQIDWTKDEREKLQKIAGKLTHLLLFQQWLNESVLWLNRVIANPNLSPAELAGLKTRRVQYWRWQKQGLQNIATAREAVAWVEAADVALRQWETELAHINYAIGSTGIEGIEALNQLEVLEEKLKLELEYLRINQQLDEEARDRWIR